MSGDATLRGICVGEALESITPRCEPPALCSRCTHTDFS